MSERRRFFPATPVQRVPGRTVELEMQLRPEAPVLAPAAPPPLPPAVGVPAATWLPGRFTTIWQNGGSPEISAEADGRTRIHFWGEYQTWWVGEPMLVGGVPAPLPTPAWRCVQVDMEPGWGESALYGVLWDAPAGAEWVLAWDSPADPAPDLPLLQGWQVSSLGDRARVDQALVTVVFVEGSGSSGEAQLVARAMLGDTVLGELVLNVTRQGW